MEGLGTLSGCTLVLVFGQLLGAARLEIAAGWLRFGDACLLRIGLELRHVIRLRLESILAIAAVAPAATAAAAAPTAFAVTVRLALAPLATVAMRVGLERGFTFALGCSGELLSRKPALAAFAATAAAPSAPAAVTIAGALALCLLGRLLVDRSLLRSLLGLVFVLVVLFDQLLLVLDRGHGHRLDRDRLGLLDVVHLLALLDHVGQLPGDGGVGVDHDRDLKAFLERTQMRALVIKEV